MQFKRPSRYSYIFQTLFWLIYLALAGLMAFKNFPNAFAAMVFTVVANTLVHVVMVNLHLYLLVHNLWRKKKYLPHVLFTAGLLFVCFLAKIFTIKVIGQFLPLPFEVLDSAPVVSLITTVFVFLVSLPFLAFDQYLEKQRLIAEMKEREYESEIRFLRAQLNPHFLFNVLNNIYSMIFTGSDEAGPTVLRLSELMRYMLYETDGKQVPLAQEANFLDKFVYLQSMKQQDNPTVNFETGDISPDIQIPPLLLIPFMENAFKHSNWDAESGKGWIKGSLKVEANELKFHLANSVCPAARKPEAGGVGLNNTRHRLQLIYPDQHQLELQQSDTHFDISLTISLNKQ